MSSLRRFQGENDVHEEADAGCSMENQCCLRLFIWCFLGLQWKAFPSVGGVQRQIQTHYQAKEGMVLTELFLQTSALHSHNKSACIIMAFFTRSRLEKGKYFQRNVWTGIGLNF